MSRGTPHSLKCPRCKRVKWNHAPVVHGVRRTGRVEERITRSAHSGHGSGGSSFYGHRGEVRCLDCGHAWFSTHPTSGRLAWWDRDHGTEAEKVRFRDAPRTRRAGEGLPSLQSVT